jgi:hypothetical protein
LNDSTLKVVKEKLECSRSFTESLARAARESQFPDNKCLFKDLAEVFDSYVSTFELILKLENVTESQHNQHSWEAIVAVRRVGRPRVRYYPVR